MEAQYATITDELANELDDMDAVVAFAPERSRMEDADVMVVFHGYADKSKLMAFHSVASKCGYLVEYGHEDREGHDRFKLHQK